MKQKQPRLLTALPSYKSITDIDDDIDVDIHANMDPDIDIYVEVDIEVDIHVDIGADINIDIKIDMSSLSCLLNKLARFSNLDIQLHCASGGRLPTCFSMVNALHTYKMLYRFKYCLTV